MYQYVYWEAIDEAYQTTDGMEYESGYNSITFDNPEEALKVYHKNKSHWDSGIKTNDKSFVELHPNIATLSDYTQ